MVSTLIAAKAPIRIVCADSEFLESEVISMKKKKKLLTALIAALLTGTLVMPSYMAFADEVVVEKPGSDAEESTNAEKTEENGNDSERSDAH